MIASLNTESRSSRPLMSVSKFERFFRSVAGLDVEKTDLKRYGEQLVEDIAMAPILAHLTALPRLSLIYSDETEAKLSSIAGGLSVAPAHTLKTIDPKLRNPQTEHWQGSFRIFDLIV